MGFVSCIVLILAGVLGAANLILAKKPDVKQWIDKIAPYQGYLGIINLAWGLWYLIHLLLNLGAYLKAAPLWFIIGMATTLVMIGLGFLLGYPLIAHYCLAKNEEAKKKAEEMRAKLTGYQANLGLAAIAIGVLFLVLNIL